MCIHARPPTAPGAVWGAYAVERVFLIMAGSIARFLIVRKEMSPNFATDDNTLTMLGNARSVRPVPSARVDFSLEEALTGPDGGAGRVAGVARRQDKPGERKHDGA